MSILCVVVQKNLHVKIDSLNFWKITTIQLFQGRRDVESKVEVVWSTGCSWWRIANLGI